MGSRLAVAVFALAVSACSGGRNCNATTCAGCCDRAGVCHSTSIEFCGEQGISCQKCSAGASCVIGACIGGSGGGSGTGGGGGGGGTATGGGAAEPKPNVMLLLDESASMALALLPGSTNCGTCKFPNCPEATCPTRMGSVRAGLSTFFVSKATVARFGLTIFPADTMCTPAGSSQQLVTISAPTDSASDLQALANAVNDAVQQQSVTGGTPTGASLAFVGTISELNGARDDYVLLVTDGLPNCNSANVNSCLQPTECKCTIGENACGVSESFQFCRAGCLDAAVTVQAVSDLLAKGIKTIVVGFGPDLTTSDGIAVLSGMANAGGWVRRCPNGNECTGPGNTCLATTQTCSQAFYAPSDAGELATALADVAATLP